MFFRTASVTDLDQLVELGKQSYGQLKQFMSSEDQSKQDQLLADPKLYLDLFEIATGAVCTINHNIVGMAFIVRSGNPNDIFKTESSYIRMLGVHPDHAGKKIAQQLTGECIEIAKSSGEELISLHTAEKMIAARHIYEKFGFIKGKEIPPRFGMKYWLYHLNLSQC